ncbi:hypothetical protein BASA62_008260 [Batrachochytrium salamandrivorans]|nr:hypothetical protein BASA62_008260 [Batrachochytrium salamandrivorans]
MTSQSSSEPTSQPPMADQSSSDQASQSTMTSQPSSTSTPEPSPLTDYEQEEMEISYTGLCGQLAELKHFSDVKREEIEETKELITKLKQECEEQTSSTCTNVDAEIAKLSQDLGYLKKQLDLIIKEYQSKLKEQSKFDDAIYYQDADYIRKNCLNPR